MNKRSNTAAIRDVTRRRPLTEETLRRNEIIVEGQKRALELAVNGGSLHEVLDVLTLCAERQSKDGIIGSILLLNKNGDRLVNGSSPNLPRDYNDAITGQKPGPAAGSCGTAAFTKREVIVSDIANDPLWKDYRQLALAHGLAACWSTPIFSSTNQLLATFAIYYRQPQKPSQEDRTAVELLSRTAGIVIEWFSEITQRKEVEAESEKQFRDFSNGIQNLAWMAYGDGWIYWYNQRWYDYTGTTIEEMQGWGWTAVHHPDHVQRTTEFISNAWQKGEEWELTFPLRDKDGQYHWFLTRACPVKDDQGRITRWIGTSTDIHDKLQIQEELLQSQNQLRQISDFMPQIVWSTDANGYHDFFNKRWYEFTGLTFDETKGDRWFKVLHPDDLERTAKIWHRSLQSGGTYEIEYRMKRHDGQYRWMLGRAIPLRRTDGTIERWFGSCTDINDQKTMAESLETLVQERTKELKRSNEDLQQFAHVASHDLKEPVRKIQLFANVIRDQFHDRLPHQVNANIQRIQKSANRIASMIEGVLLYSSLDGSKMIVEDIDLNAIVKEVETELELIVAGKNARMSYGNLPAIRGVPTLIYQLFYNLINNSLKFSDPRRQLLVRIHSNEIKDHGRAFHEIVLEDNGIGFNDLYAEAIFSTFTRLHPKDKYEGTGLGLALCKKIVERHGGSITATGRENSGAKFTILWPIKE